MDRRFTPPRRVTSPIWGFHLHVNRPLSKKARRTHIAEQLSMAATAWVIWLYACVRYWPGRRSVYRYPASRGYILAVWAGVRKAASADNRSILYRACAKFVTRFASNWFVKSASVSRESKLRKLLANNSPRAFVLFCFSALPPLVLSIFTEKTFHRILFFKKVFLCYQLL